MNVIVCELLIYQTEQSVTYQNLDGIEWRTYDFFMNLAMFRNISPPPLPRPHDPISL